MYVRRTCEKFRILLDTNCGFRIHWCTTRHLERTSRRSLRACSDRFVLNSTVRPHRQVHRATSDRVLPPSRSLLLPPTGIDPRPFPTRHAVHARSRWCTGVYTNTLSFFGGRLKTNHTWLSKQRDTQFHRGSDSTRWEVLRGFNQRRNKGSGTHVSEHARPPALPHQGPPSSMKEVAFFFAFSWDNNRIIAVAGRGHFGA